MSDLVTRCAVKRMSFWVRQAGGRKSSKEKLCTVMKAHGELLDDVEEGVEGSFRHQSKGINLKASSAIP